MVTNTETTLTTFATVLRVALSWMFRSLLIAGMLCVFVALATFGEVGRLKAELAGMRHTIELEVARQLAAKEAQALQEETVWRLDVRTATEVNPSWE